MCFVCCQCENEITESFNFLNPKNENLDISYDLITEKDVIKIKQKYKDILLCEDCKRKLLEDTDVILYGLCQLCSDKIVYHIEDLIQDKTGFNLCKFEHKDEFKDSY